jgi:Ni,Fe-hydrogenase III small subunit
MATGLILQQFDSSEYGVPVVSNPQSRSDILLPLGAPDRPVFIVREA